MSVIILVEDVLKYAKTQKGLMIVHVMMDTV